MSYIVIGMQLLWGAGNDNKPALPDGYRYVEKYHEWLMAEWRGQQLGRNIHEVFRFYVSTEASGVLYRQRLSLHGRCRECGRDTSKFYVDEDTTIQLPQKQLTWPEDRSSWTQLRNTLGSLKHL